MITLYTFGTANGRKVSIMLEEIGAPYKVESVDILKGAQFDPSFVKINPNSKIPVILDDDGPGGAPLSLFESGAILIYLAEKFSSKLLPGKPSERYETIAWLMFQMANTGPMFGQYHHFKSHAKEHVPYALERYRKEVHRLYDVMEQRLASVPYLAGADYTIADIASFTWVARFEDPAIEMGIGNHPSLRRWFMAIRERPAVRRGMAVPNT